MIEKEWHRLAMAKSSANRFKRHCRKAFIAFKKEQFTTILIRQYHTELNQEGKPFVFDFRIQETTRQFYFQHSTEKDLAFCFCYRSIWNTLQKTIATSNTGRRSEECGEKKNHIQEMICLASSVWEKSCTANCYV